MIPKSGIAAVETQLREIPQATPVTGAASRSLSEASADYALLMPYLLPLVYPRNTVEPLGECFRATGTPSEHKYILLENEMFEMGRRGEELGLAGNALHLVPKRELPVIVNFIRSMVLFSVEDAVTFSLAIQHLRTYDPLTKRKQIPIDVYAVVLGTATHVYGWADKYEKLSLATTFVPKAYDKLHAASAVTLVNQLITGDTNPLITAEQIHGPRQIATDTDQSQPSSTDPDVRIDSVTK